jgi:hypothetical protein
LIASILAGAVWDVRLFNTRLMAPFAIGAACALVAIPVIFLIRIRQPQTATS